MLYEKSADGMSLVTKDSTIQERRYDLQFLFNQRDRLMADLANVQTLIAEAEKAGVILSQPVRPQP